VNLLHGDRGVSLCPPYCELPMGYSLGQCDSLRHNNGMCLGQTLMSAHSLSTDINIQFSLVVNWLIDGEYFGECLFVIIHRWYSFIHLLRIFWAIDSSWRKHSWDGSTQWKPNPNFYPHKKSPKIIRESVSIIMVQDIKMVNECFPKYSVTN